MLIVLDMTISEIRINSTGNYEFLIQQFQQLMMIISYSMYTIVSDAGSLIISGNKYRLFNDLACWWKC